MAFLRCPTVHKRKRGHEEIKKEKMRFGDDYACEGWLAIWHMVKCWIMMGAREKMDFFGDATSQ